MSRFAQIPLLPPDPIFGLSCEFRADTRSNKFTLVTGYFRDDDLVTPVLESVAEVENRLAAQRLNRQYLPIDGDSEYVAALGELVFGEHWNTETICGFQTVGGTGALYLAGRLASHFSELVVISNHTWANHKGIFEAAGLKTGSYPYYSNNALQFDLMLEELKGLPEGACVLIHTSCHNPTGFDLSNEQWQEIAEAVKEKNLFPILDMAYQGFGADPEEDAYGPRLFYERGIEFALTYTCAKNFSIYSERAGALFFVLGDKSIHQNVRSQVKAMIRSMYSNPPIHGSEIVKGVLKDPDLKAKWLGELAKMRKRMQSMRGHFVDKLCERDSEGGWEALLQGKGLFCMSGLKPESIKRLKAERAIYLNTDGRINLTGLNQSNLDLFISALLEVK